jgi:hypothetical protein
MKTHVCTSRSWYLALSLLALATARPALAQDPNIFPTVTISATDARAGEGGSDTGTFTVIRRVAMDTPPPSTSLVVFYRVSGTASNGGDYQALSGSVTIPPLALGATITVTPIDDAAVEGEETVVLQLTGSPLACATCGYNIGVPSNAVVVIADNDLSGTNHPPLVQLNAPQDGDVFTAPVNIALRAYAQDAENHFDLKVEFFEGTNGLGFGTFVATLCPAPYCPFFALTWSNVPPGRYELTARATDASGGVAVSAPARIAVGETNIILPVVNIFATDDTGLEIPVVPPWLGMVQEADPIVFTVTRTGPTNLPLTVFYSFGGTASNGVDYIFGGASLYELPGGTTHRAGAVTIPAGASSAHIEGWVIDDFEVEGTETVELTLGLPVWPCFFSDPPCLIVNPPPNYVIGPSNHAAANMLDNDLKPAPVVTIVASDPGAAESGLDPGKFTVSRTGDTSNPLGVFYAVGGTAEEGVDYLPLANPQEFFHIFTGLNFLEIPAGAPSADIVVTPIDDHLAEGNETVLVQLRPQVWWPVVIGAPSNAVVTIADNDLAGTNLPPAVQMIRPVSGESFVAGTSIQLVAFAQDAEDHYNLQVEFFEGTHPLGFGTFFPGRCAVCPNYGLVWSNVPPGAYTLTAKATDSTGASTVSAPVHITVVTNPPPPPPPTNGPVVNIVARDPFASEGTNFWRSDWDANRWAIEIWNPWHVNIGGTNTATFVVRRHGSTNDDLTVNYEIGGTASNGVDYVVLPGSVTISAGKRTVQIVVMPNDDILTEGMETIVLKLRPSTDYATGFPSHAAAIIIDNDQPRPPCVLLPDHRFHFCQPASNGFCFRVEASTDLRNWIPVCTNVVTDGALHYVDPDSPPSNVRFYRVEPELGLPPDD